MKTMSIVDYSFYFYFMLYLPAIEKPNAICYTKSLKRARFRYISKFMILLKYISNYANNLNHHDPTELIVNHRFIHLAIQK